MLMPTVISRFTRSSYAFVLVVAFGCGYAVAEDLSKLSDEELVRHFDDRPGYKAEFQKRLAEYGPEEQAAAKELLLRERFKPENPPEEASEDELIATVRSAGSTRAGHKALEELKARYADADAGTRAALFERLRAEYRSMPYPERGDADTPSREAFSQWEAWRSLSTVAKACLQEEAALRLFKEFYLDSGREGAITQFLGVIEGEPFTGEATLKVLEEIGERISGYDRRKLDELGEHETLDGILVTRLRQCGDYGFEALKETPWQRSGSGVYTMGSFKNPEARALLLELYASLPQENPLSGGKRLEVLTALMFQWDRENDIAFRDMLRSELTRILEMNHNENPIIWSNTVGLIEKTGDPWFIPKLRECRANLDFAEIRRVSTLPQPEDYLEPMLENLQQSIAQAIAKLEKEKEKLAEVP